MAREQARGWRFAMPGSPAPGLRVTAQGGIQTVAGAEAVKQSIRLLLSTIPGERVMRPEYGCHLQRLVFMPNDDTTAGLAIHFVRRALQRWEPRVDIIRLDAGSGAQPELLEISLDYRVKATQEIARLDYILDLSGDER